METTPQDIRNASYRAQVAASQNAAYLEASLLALAALGPGWLPWMRVSLIDADHRRTGDRTPAAVAFKVHRGDERTSEHAKFIRRLPDGRILKGDTPEDVFGDMLDEKHPTMTIQVKGEKVPVGRWEMTWSAMEEYHPRDAQSLSKARVSRENRRVEKADRKFAEENPLLSWAERSSGKVEEQGRF